MHLDLRPLLALFVAASIAACQPSKVLVRPEDWAAVKLTESHSSSEVQRGGTTAVILTLRQNGERPDDFYLGPVRETKDGKVEFPLYHKSNFGERDLSVRALEGNSRIMVYDPAKNEIATELYWQGMAPLGDGEEPESQPTARTVFREELEREEQSLSNEDHDCVRPDERGLGADRDEAPVAGRETLGCISTGRLDSSTQSAEPPCTGPVRTVVWEGGREASPYPDWASRSADGRGVR